jgi:hypothetical protein
MADWVKTGKADVDPAKLGHTPGIKQGNATGAYESQSGHLPDGRGTAERATGINAKKRDPIDPSMPNLMPG